MPRRKTGSQQRKRPPREQPTQEQRRARRTQEQIRTEAGYEAPPFILPKKGGIPGPTTRAGALALLRRISKKKPARKLTLGEVAAREKAKRAARKKKPR